jgi:hypothetical protein
LGRDSAERHWWSGQGTLARALAVMVTAGATVGTLIDDVDRFKTIALTVDRE